jgi:hypothetical protein
MMRVQASKGSSPSCPAGNGRLGDAALPGISRRIRLLRLPPDGARRLSKVDQVAQDVQCLSSNRITIAKTR